MKTLLLTLISAIFLIGCSGKKTPTWLVDTESYVSKLKIAKLSGYDKEAGIYKQKALAAVKQSANIGMMQVIELTDAAMDTVLLREANLTSYERLSKIEQNSTNDTYKQMLYGNVKDVNPLPIHYLGFATALSKSDIKSAFENAKTIDDETSKLVALGILAKLEPQNKVIYEEILSVSKPLGYRGVTIAAMSRLQAIYTKEGDKEKAAKALLVLEELKR